MKIKKILNILLIAIIISLCAGTFGFTAFSASAGAVDQNTNALASAVAKMSQSTGVTVTTKPALPKADYTSNIDWTSPQTLHGIYSTSDIYFTLPTYWKTQYACIQINYTLSQLIKGSPCSLTFSINGQPFYSCVLSYTNGETQTLYVQIPSLMLKDDAANNSNYLEVTGYARLYDDNGCIDDYSDANWVTINENSGVQVGYNLIPYNNSIDYYPYPFISSVNSAGSDTAIEVADPTQDDEVATAMYIMSNVSNNTVNKNAITIGSWDSLKTNNYKNRILISTTSDLPSELSGYISNYRSQLKGQVLVLSVTDANKQPLLLIVSDDSDCLMEAANFLADSARVSEVHTNSVVIKKGTADIMKNAKKLSSMNVNQYTLQGVTGGGLDFVGPFHQTKTLFMPLPEDYTLSSASKITLKFRYSTNLDFQRSMLTVYWGTVPIASKKLSLANAGGDELAFTVPPDVVGTSAGTFTFAFDLEIPDLVCTPRQDEMPWAYITPDSTFYLPAQNDVKLQFDNQPAPFQKNGSLNDVLLIMSDHPTNDELTLLGRTIALYGTGADAYGNLKVQKTSEFSTKDVNYNIIATGTPESDKFIDKVNDNLYFKYNSSNNQFLTNDKLILADDYAKSIGTLQLLPSPYAKNRALLVLTGPTDSSLTMVNNLLSDKVLSSNLKNDCVLIDSEGKIKTFQFQNTDLSEKKPTLSQTIASNKSSILFALAGTSVMLILFLAAVLIFVKSKINKNKH
jgi:hypothetical protein